MKEARKTPNLYIRDSSRHSSHRPESTKLKPIPNLNQDKPKRLKNKGQQMIDLKRQFVEAENLTEQEQSRIRKQAQKNATKKMKKTQAKIETDLISMLESECNKLGSQIEKQKAENRNLKVQIAELMKKVDFLSCKIERMHQDKEILYKNNNNEQLQKGQFKQELAKLRSAYQQLYEEKEEQACKYQKQIRSLKDEMLKYIDLSSQLEHKVESMMTEKRQITEELNEKTNECDYIRSTFQKKKQEWDQKQLEIQGSAKQHLDKKGEKITKYQIQVQEINEKLKQQENVRKKTTDKNQQLQKELSKKIDAIRDLEEQTSNLKKRVNDLSILKSSNNTIMNQKLQQLTEENLKLKKTIEIMKKKGTIPQETNSKPLLFGAEDYN